MKMSIDHDVIAGVDLLDNSINIDEALIETLPPSQIMKVLLHEFRHIQQYKQLNEQEVQELREQRIKSPHNPIIPISWQKFYHPQVLVESKKTYPI